MMRIAKSKEKREMNKMKGKRFYSLKCTNNDKGIALVTVLVLSLISLGIISTLIYLVIQGTRFTGYYKRYETARTSALGGSEFAADLIRGRGELVVPTLVNLPYSCDCGDIDDPDDNLDSLGNRTCLCDKLCDNTADWDDSCDISIDPTSNPDMQFQLPGPGNTNYQVSVKIVDTVKGNSDMSGEQLGGTGVVSSTSGVIPAPPMPYLHRVEINAEDTGNLEERARLSVLYAF